jgi:hypothetical protein
MRTQARGAQPSLSTAAKQEQNQKDGNRNAEEPEDYPANLAPAAIAGWFFKYIHLIISTWHKEQ